jgi:hypothetical protein
VRGPTGWFNGLRADDELGSKYWLVILFDSGLHESVVAQRGDERGAKRRIEGKQKLIEAECHAERGTSVKSERRQDAQTRLAAFGPESSIRISAEGEFCVMVFR